MKLQPEYSLRGKKLTLSWEDTLQSNTTYQFNFGKSVVDIHEGNPKSDLIYVFSTGDKIDSLFISGRVIRASDNQPSTASFVMIYTNNLDSLPLTSPPSYFAQTDSSGYFKIRYLPQGDFKVFALKEENTNYIYNGPPEEIGFLDYTVSSGLNDSTAAILLTTFIEKDTIQYVKDEKSTDYGYYELVFNIPTTHPDIRFVDVESGETLESVNVINADKDTLRSWVKFPDRANFEEVAVYFKDGSAFVDTSFWYIETNPKYRKESALTVTANTAQKRLGLTKTFALNFNNPLIEIDTSLIFILEDSVVVQPANIELESTSRKINFFYPFKPESNYLFRAMPGAFRGIFENYSDSLSIAFSLQNTEFYGSLTAQVVLNDTMPYPVILRLLDDKNTELARRTFRFAISAEFKQLKPGKYHLAVIYDRNGNGTWDTGSYRAKRQPEKLSFYPEPIEIRSNWDFEIEWIPRTSYSGSAQ